MKKAIILLVLLSGCELMHTELREDAIKVGTLEKENAIHTEVANKENAIHVEKEAVHIEPGVISKDAVHVEPGAVSVEKDAVHVEKDAIHVEKDSFGHIEPGAVRVEPGAVSFQGTVQEGAVQIPLNVNEGAVKLTLNVAEGAIVIRGVEQGAIQTQIQTPWWAWIIMGILGLGWIITKIRGQVTKNRELDKAPRRHGFWATVCDIFF